MSWAKIDDKLWSHPKIVGLPPQALRLWLFALSWAAGHETDGHIPRAILPIILGNPKLAAVLVSARLWETAEGGWQIHDFVVYSAPAGLTHAYRVARPAILARDGGACRYCGAAADTVDHIVPRCQGGHDRETNLASACRRCNTRKGGRTPAQAGMALQ